MSNSDCSVDRFSLQPWTSSSCPIYHLHTLQVWKRRTYVHLCRQFSSSNRQVVIARHSPNLWDLRLHLGKWRLPTTHPDCSSSNLSNWSLRNQLQRWSWHNLNSFSHTFRTSFFRVSRSGVVEVFLDWSLSYVLVSIVNTMELPVLWSVYAYKASKCRSITFHLSSKESFRWLTSSDLI